MRHLVADLLGSVIRVYGNPVVAVVSVRVLIRDKGNG